MPSRDRPRRLSIAALCFVAIVAAPKRSVAAASARLVYLRGPGAEQCPGEQAVRAAVSARLGYDPFFAWAHGALFAEIQRRDGAFLTVVKLVDENNPQREARQSYQRRDVILVRSCERATRELDAVTPTEGKLAS